MLVAGGVGFVGSNFVHYLLSTRGDIQQVMNFDLLTYAGNLENLTDIEKVNCTGKKR